MEENAIGRHLLSVGGTRDAAADFGTPGIVLAAVCSALLLIVAIAMCVCKEKKKRSSDPDTPDTEVTTNHKPQTNGPVDDTAVQVDIESCIRHSNGSAVIIKDTTENGRPKSHDQRALPDIPAVSQASVSQTEDEEEADGIYDIIAKDKSGRKVTAATASSTKGLKSSKSGSPKKSGETTPTHKGHNLYEKVDSDTNDPTYAGVPSDSSDPGYSGVRNPYAMVDNIGTADYAHIEERKTTPKKKKVPTATLR